MTIDEIVEEIKSLTGDGAYIKEDTTSKEIRVELMNSEINPVVLRIRPADKDYAYKQILKGVRNYYKHK
jgi:hypothetical protein